MLIELRYLQTYSVIERIQAFLQQHDPNLNLDEATLKSLLRQSRFLLLFDGLNELPSEDARQVEALKAIFNHPLVSIPIETIKGWVEAE